MVHSTLRPPQDDLAHRRPVWEALSVLFLDTELSDSDFAALATVLAQSPYTDVELAAIYHAEVTPVCRSNIGMAPGYWAGFPDGWVEQAILSGGLDASRVVTNMQHGPGEITWGWGGLQQSVLQLRTLRVTESAPANN